MYISFDNKLKKLIVIGDPAIFLLSGATEVVHEGEKYYIVPQSAILMLEREESL